MDGFAEGRGDARALTELHLLRGEDVRRRQTLRLDRARPLA
jgi:hypothetical protein